MAYNGLKIGSFHLFGHPKCSGIFLGKDICNPFLTYFWSQNGRMSRHFGIFGGPKRATTGSKRAKNTCFGILRGLGSFLKKIIFLHQVDLVDPFWHPPLLATCRSPVGLGAGV